MPPCVAPTFPRLFFGGQLEDLVEDPTYSWEVCWVNSVACCDNWFSSSLLGGKSRNFTFLYGGDCGVIGDTIAGGRGDGGGVTTDAST